jgi:hypothetical protein
VLKITLIHNFSNKKLHSYITAKTNYISIRWWWGQLCSRPTRLFGFS